MALGNESPKEFWFGVLEDLSQDLGFWSIICVISHVTLQKLLTHYKRYLQKHCQPSNLCPQCSTLNSFNLKGPQFEKITFLLNILQNFYKTTWEITQNMDQKPKSCERSSISNKISFVDSFPRPIRGMNMTFFFSSLWLHPLASLVDRCPTLCIYKKLKTSTRHSSPKRGAGHLDVRRAPWCWTTAG